MYKVYKRIGLIRVRVVLYRLNYARACPYGGYYYRRKNFEKINYPSINQRARPCAWKYRFRK